MAFRDLDEFLHVEPIRLPIRGKAYEFPGSISARAGLVIRRLGEAHEEARRAGEEGREVDPAAVLLDGDDELDLRVELFGDAEREMAEDGLSTAHVQHVFNTLIVWHLAGQEAAERAWEALDPPEPNRADRRAASSGSATSTRPQGSTSGTRAPRKRPGSARGGATS